MNNKKNKLTLEQKALFYPYVDKLMEDSTMVLGDSVKVMLMFQFNMGPYMAMQVQREYRLDQWRRNDQRDSAPVKDTQGGGLLPETVRDRLRLGNFSGAQNSTFPSDGNKPRGPKRARR